jgi:hypothetical protein
MEGKNQMIPSLVSAESIKKLNEAGYRIISWHDWVNGLGLTGMTKLLAMNCEFRSIVGDVIDLAIGEHRRCLANNKALVDKFTAAINRASRKNYKLKFTTIARSEVPFRD